jgi:hypothetical protein
VKKLRGMGRLAWLLKTMAGASALVIATSAAASTGQAKSSFMVHVELTARKDSASCDKTVLGSTVNVTCMPAGQAPSPVRPQQLFVFRPNHEWFGTIDAMMSTGTITSWRVVRGIRWDYIELVVGW